MSDKENNINTKHRVPFDREYATSYRSEVKWLAEHGIRYEFVKEINTISIYKYKKNSVLYFALGEFYKSLESRNVKDLEEKN